MQSKLLSTVDELRLFALVLDPDEEATSAIKAFATQQAVRGASVSAIGAFRQVTVGWFDFDAKDYRRIPVQEQCEALSLLGDIGQDVEGKSSLHLHAVLGLSDGSTRGGHLMEAIVRPTLEVMITETPAHLCRRQQPDLGVALLDLGRSEEHQAMDLAERTDLSPRQAAALIRKHGQDNPQIEQEARIYKAES